MTSWRELLPLSGQRRSYSTNPVGSYPVTQLQHEMNRLFLDFFGDWKPFVELSGQDGFIPSINVEETPEQYVVTCDVPGVDEKDIKIQIVDKGIVIRGERKHHSESREGTRMTRMESSYGSFERLLHFEYPVKEDAIDAVLKAGQLKIILPKMESRKGGKVISVRRE